MQILVNGLNIADRLLEYKLNAQMNSDSLIIGNAVSKQLIIKLSNNDGFMQSLLEFPFILLPDEVHQTGVFRVYESPEKYTQELSLTLYDNMHLFDQRYDTKLNYPTTIAQQLTEMSQLTGIMVDVTGLSVGTLNKEVNWYDNTVSMRNYLGWIAELDGCNAFAASDGSIVFRDLATACYNTIDVESYEKEDHVIFNRVCFDDGILKLEIGSNDGNTLYLSSNNGYVDSSTSLQPIYDKYKGLSFYSATGVKMANINGWELGDLINYNDEFTFMLLGCEEVYGGGTYSIATVTSKLDTKNAEMVINRIDPSLKIRRLQVIVDKNKQTLELLAEDVNENTENIGSLKLTTESIAQNVSDLEKKIENIETNTVSASISASNNATLNIKNSFVTLKAKVIIDGKDSTTELTDLSFIWHRVSGNRDQDIEWDQNHSTGHKELNVGYNDVDLYANFYCTVTTTYGVFISNYLPVTDETDVSNLQVYISANQPTYQEYNGNSYSPDWTTSDNLVLTPVVLDNFLNVPLSECQITWKKTSGDLDQDELVTDGILTVSSNKLNSDIKSVTYVCDIQYHYSSLSKTITFSSCKDQEETVVGDVTYYTWVYYADNSNGDGISKTSAGKSYIGVANMQTEKEPPYTTNEEGQKIYTDLSAFVWTRMVDFKTILKQEGEPSDITVLWLDTTTGQLKKHYQFLQAWAPIDSETSIRDNAENVFVTTEKSNNANFTVLSNSIAATVKSVEKVSSDLGSQLEELSTKQEQTASSVNTTISKVTELTDSITGLVTKEEFHTYFKFQEDGLHISKSQGSFEMVLSDTELAFYEGGTRVAYISNKRLYIEQVVVVQSLQVGDYLLRYDNDVGFIIQ